MIDDFLPKEVFSKATPAVVPRFETQEEFHEGVGRILQTFAGINTDDEHGRETPKRFLGMLDELTACKYADEEHLDTCIKWKVFPAETDEMIVVQNIPFTSLCNHHLVPFMGVAHVAYVPHACIAGLSKFGRVVKHFARQPQVQERLTAQVANYLLAGLRPRGVGVVIQAEHLCMTIRGVQTPGAITTTSAMHGVFGDHSRTAKAEFLALLK